MTPAIKITIEVRANRRDFLDARIELPLHVNCQEGSRNPA